MTSRLLTALLLLPLLAGCGGGAGDPPGLDPGEDLGLPRGEFVAVDLPAPFDDGDQLRLTLDDRRLTFSATCNTLSGTLSRVGDVLGVGGVGGTELGCPGAGARQDEWLASFFTSGPRFEPRDVGFALTAFGDELLFVPPDAVPGGDDVALEGTDWRLTGIEETDGDSVGFEQVPRRIGAGLLVDDGAVTFDTGCNAGGGQVAVERRVLRLRQVAIENRGCLDDRGDLESRQLPVLMARRVDWSIGGGRLRLSRGPTTLVYRSAR